MARQRTIKVSEGEYEALRKAKEEMEKMKNAQLTRSLPGEGEIDWGSLALGAVVGIAAIALLAWLAEAAVAAESG